MYLSIPRNTNITITNILLVCFIVFVSLKKLFVLLFATKITIPRSIVHVKNITLLFTSSQSGKSDPPSDSPLHYLTFFLVCDHSPHAADHTSGDRRVRFHTEGRDGRPQVLGETGGPGPVQSVQHQQGCQGGL